MWEHHAPDAARRNEVGKAGDDSLQPMLARPPLKVFLVEDSISVRDRLIELLADPGNVEIIGYAESQDASLAKMRNGSVDVAIVDLNLKGGSGFGVIEAMRAQNANAREGGQTPWIPALRLALPPGMEGAESPGRLHRCGCSSC